MSKSVNKVQLLGNLGGEVEVLTTTSGTMIAKWSMATNWKRKVAEGQYEDEVDWHRCVAFGKTAEIAEKYLAKGERVFVEGRVTYSTVDGPEGKRYFTDIRVHELVLLGNRPSPVPGEGYPPGTRFGRGGVMSPPRHQPMHPGLRETDNPTSMSREDNPPDDGNYPF